MHNSTLKRLKTFDFLLIQLPFYKIKTPNLKISGVSLLLMIKVKCCIHQRHMKLRHYRKDL